MYTVEKTCELSSMNIEKVFKRKFALTVEKIMFTFSKQSQKITL